MKTFQIELQKVKSMSNRDGLVHVKIDALVQPNPARVDDSGGTLLSMSEETARVMLLLIKQQLAEFDSRKARSQR